MVAHYAIGFADMVGFTSRSATSSVGQLTELIDRFESKVTEAVVGSGGRVVKFIGDEVMFAFQSAPAACTCGTTLLELANAEAIPTSVSAWRWATSSAASATTTDPWSTLGGRLVQAAPPRSALVTSDLASRVEGETFSSFGELELRGIPEPVTALQLA